MKTIILITSIVITSISFNLQADQPVCHDNNGSPYCQYIGFVKQIYINAGGTILIYFDTPLNISDATSVGYNVSNNNATAYLVSDNPDFAKLFYSTALTAQVSKRKISMLMHGVHSGYLKFDRIWLAE